MPDLSDPGSRFYPSVWYFQCFGIVRLSDLSSLCDISDLSGSLDLSGSSHLPRSVTSQMSIQSILPTQRCLTCELVAAAHVEVLQFRAVARDHPQAVVGQVVAVRQVQVLQVQAVVGARLAEVQAPHLVTPWNGRNTDVTTLIRTVRGGDNVERDIPDRKMGRTEKPEWNVRGHKRLT